MNDNVLQNIDGMSLEGIKKYHNEEDNESRVRKQALEEDETNQISKELVERHDVKTQSSLLNKAIDKILLSHRNTKIFLFMLSGPFFLSL